MVFLFNSPYAIPQQTTRKAGTDAPGALTFQSVCTNCHQADRVENYQGSKTWAEIIKLMQSFGAFMTEDQSKEIEQYLQATYPK